MALVFQCVGFLASGNDVVITEIMTLNSTFPDDDGDFSDLIEIYNDCDMAVDLDGWYLTDDPLILGKWQFPQVVLDPGEFLVIYASGKNRSFPGIALHTNFNLKSLGEQLVLVAPDAQTIVSGFVPMYPPQAEDFSYGIAFDTGVLQQGVELYFPEPTPGMENGPGFAEVAEKPEFSQDDTTFIDSLSFSLSVINPAVDIHFTTDGTEPTDASPVIASGSPIMITETSTIRARGFETGKAPSTTTVRIFIKIDNALLSVESNLPILVIDTVGQTIVDGPWFDCFMAVMDVDEKTGRSSISGTQDFAGTIGFKLRGTFSLLLYPKNNYAVEVRDEKGNDLSVSILGYPTEADWLLHGPYADKSLMRNHIAFEWSNEIGRYAVRTQFVELYLDSSYHGVYVFMEKIKRDRDRVDIERLLGSSIVEPAVKGGYILKKDRPEPDESGLQTDQGTVLNHVYPKEANIAPEQSAWILDYLNQFETALYGEDFKDPEIGYARYIDVDSFIDHHLLTELLKNIDGFRLSTFMFKSREGKLNMGPLWDFNLALRNAFNFGGPDPEGWYSDVISGDDYPWYPRLFEDVDFEQKYIDRWNFLFKNVLTLEYLLGTLDEAVTILGEAVARNFMRWPILGITIVPNIKPVAETYEAEIDLMKFWIEERVFWIEDIYTRAPRFNQDGGPINSGFELTMIAPVGASGNIYYTDDSSDPRLSGGSPSPVAQEYISGNPVTLNQNTRIRSRAFRPEEGWSGLTEATFYTEIPSLVITEIMFHPADGQSPVHLPDDFEFMEFKNIGELSVTLEDIQFTDGIEFDFTNSPISSLGPGETMLIVSNLEAFESIHDTSGMLIAGEYTLNLSNASESISLVGPLGVPIHEFSYNDLWYPETDGGGFSLVIRDPLAPRDSWNDMESWRVSNLTGGSPGVQEAVPGLQKPGDTNQDGALNIADSVKLLGRLFLTFSTTFPCDGTSMEEGGNLFIFDFNGDSSVNISDAVSGLNFLFNNGRPPQNGEICILVEGCKNACTP